MDKKKKKTSSSRIQVNQAYREIKLDPGENIQEAVSNMPCIPKEWLGNTRNIQELGIAASDISDKNICQTFVKYDLALADKQEKLHDVNYLNVEINATPILDWQLSNLANYVEDIVDQDLVKPRVSNKNKRR